MEKQVIIAFGIMSFMGWYGSAITSKRTIEDIEYHNKHYPNKYIMPDIKMRKIFGLKKKEIPKWLYRELFMSFVYIAMFIVSAGMILMFDNKPFIAVVFFILYITVWSAQITHILINLVLFKK